MRENQDKFVWSSISNLDELEEIRMSAMKRFIDDFERGINQNRYLTHELPNHLNFEENSFELGLSSHFLFYIQN